MTDDLKLKDIPFYWRVKKNSDDFSNDIPIKLPFSFAFDNKNQLLIQKRNKKIIDYLNKIYLENSNVGYLQEDHSLSTSYGNEFLNFVYENTSKWDYRNRSAIDVGCGGIYLLNKLKEQGFDVVGMDPSPVTVKTGLINKIKIINTFYPSESYVEKHDLILHYDVLEHVDNPNEFIFSHHKNLNDEGIIVFAVPDCSSSIIKGDLSMILHEHLNYFDKNSLKITVQNSGFEVISIVSAKNGGVLYCSAKKNKNKPTKEYTLNNGNIYKDYLLKANQSIIKFKSILKTFKNCEVGFYIPLRAFPYISQCEVNYNIRFFDDDPNLHRLFYDGFDVPIENIFDLSSNVPDIIFICSFSFAEVILKKIIDQGIPREKIVLWKDLFE